MDAAGTSPIGRRVSRRHARGFGASAAGGLRRTEHAGCARPPHGAAHGSSPTRPMRTRRPPLPARRRARPASRKLYRRADAMTALSSSTSTPPMSGWSSRRCERRCNRKPVPAQALLIPEIVDLPEDDCDRLMAHAEELKRLGLGNRALRARRPSPSAKRRRCSARWMPPASCASLPTRLPNGTRPTGLPAGSNISPRPWPATAPCAPAAGCGPEEMNALLAPDGSDAGLRPMQSRPADLYRTEARPTSSGCSARS